MDGLEYTFNGLGEYYLINAPEENVIIQARTGQAMDINGNALPKIACQGAFTLAISTPFSAKRNVNAFNAMLRKQLN